MNFFKGLIQGLCYLAISFLIVSCNANQGGNFTQNNTHSLKPNSDIPAIGNFGNECVLAKSNRYS